MASQLTAESVQLRTSELFPPGATAPAVKPRLPPVVEEPTNELARLVFDASGRVKRVKGLLAGEEASGYIIADHLGIELLKEEALTLGESVRKAAVAAKKKDDALNSTARAKKSRGCGTRATRRTTLLSCALCRRSTPSSQRTARRCGRS